MAEKKIRVALMSYAMDNRAAKGTGLYTHELIANMLGDERFEFTLVHFEKVDDTLYQKANEIIIPELTLPAATRFVRTLLFFWKYRNDQFDIIHWFQPRLYPFFWLAPAKKIVVTAHGAGDITAIGKFPLSRRMFNFVLKHFNRKVDALIGDSEFGKQEIVEYYGADPSHIHAILLGGGEKYKQLDKANAQNIVAERYKIRAPFILDISRLQPHKNIDRLIIAYDVMRTGHPERTEKLVIVGWPVSGHERTYELAKNSPFSADISFVGYVEQVDLNALYSAAEVFVFPSLNEGFGLPIIEAFASGTPVVTSNITSMPEIGGGAALIVDPYSPEDIARAMNTILADTTLRNELIRKGHTRAAGFMWKNTAKETLELYREVLGVDKDTRTR